MVVKKLIIQGEHYTVQFFEEEDKSIRVELNHDVSEKYYKFFPDNKIIFKEN